MVNGIYGQRINVDVNPNSKEEITNPCSYNDSDSETNSKNQNLNSKNQLFSREQK